MNRFENSFTIVIPTYTGEDFIGDCLDSILAQDSMDMCEGVVIVIDGPNDSLRRIVDSYASKFKIKKILYKVIQFDINMGRLHARLAGAKSATSKYLLFVDDRAVLTAGYVKTIISRREDVIIPTVSEASYPNVMSLAMARVRTAVFKAGKPIADKQRYITSNNFDNLPKGTTSIWVPKNIFIEISENVSQQTKNAKTVSDDTRILRGVIDSGRIIHRDDVATILYQPRAELAREFEHTYKRGPLFIDYYLRKNSRYLFPLLIFYVGFAVWLVVLLLEWKVALALVAIAAAIIFIASMRVANYTNEIGKVFIGTLLVCVAFSAGLLVGAVKKVID